MQSLTFQNLSLTPVAIDAQIWLSSADLANALGYSRVDNITTIYNRNADEFTSSMTALIPNPKMKNANIRIFSLRGCHLIAMFARTKVAKEFRGWVLDILDKEVGQPTIQKTTAFDRTPLRQAVTALCVKLGIMHPEAYALVHQYMGVEHIDEIAMDDLPKAVAYVHGLMIKSSQTDTPQLLKACARHLKDYTNLLKSLRHFPLLDEQIARHRHNGVAMTHNQLIKLLYDY
ncbi:Bro-N domain-containing protein [Moraxella sp. Pampa]|uniref:BRO-N domain-containing protein n=1 Tax=Moraxella sp. Pampa TaxID=3111978 RepID=UPI002B4167C4|nr:BRO family protein [Moraxella sp. Pampa]